MKKIFIIYDGILNSVFSSMVLTPLLKELEGNPTLETTLISFEKDIIPKDKLSSLVPAHDRLHFILAEKYRFFGIISLLPAISQLKRLLKTINGTITARGPLAGYIALKAANSTIVVQARGLAAEEHRYAKNFEKSSFLKNVVEKIIYNQLKKIEKYVYGSNKISIETVSSSLKEYLVTTFNSNESKITVTKNDIPKKLDSQKIQQYRASTRKELSINNKKQIYCYSGSARPWQCVEETINFFNKKYLEDENSFLLILSADKKNFENLLLQSKIPHSAYRVVSVKPEDLLQYLAACDCGLLFRKKDVINWVSRPTKALEYQAAGLTVMHNNTVAYLSKQ